MRIRIKGWPSLAIGQIISRRREGWDQLIPAHASDWERHRAAIIGVQEGVRRGELDACEPELVDADLLPPEALSPIPTKVLEEAGVLHGRKNT